jgi:hypothetical protein
MGAIGEGGQDNDTRAEAGLRAYGKTPALASGLGPLGVPVLVGPSMPAVRPAGGAITSRENSVECPGHAVTSVGRWVPTPGWECGQVVERG